MDTVIAIGYNGTNNSDEFYLQVRSIIERFGTLNAEISGLSSSLGWGTEGATWFAASFDARKFTEAASRILAVGGAHNQDAIAFTIGSVDIVDCPKPEPKPAREYRDFL